MAANRHLGKGSKRFASFRADIGLLPTIPVVEAFRRHLNSVVKDTHPAHVKWLTHPEEFEEWLKTYPIPELIVHRLEDLPLDWTKPTMPTISIGNADNDDEQKIHALGWRPFDSDYEYWPRKKDFRRAGDEVTALCQLILCVCVGIGGSCSSYAKLQPPVSLWPALLAEAEALTHPALWAKAL